MFGKNHTEEARAKMTGIKRSEETRVKISSSLIGNKRSEETRAKLVAAQKDKSKQIEVTDLTTNQTTIYESIRAAGRAF